MTRTYTHTKPNQEFLRICRGFQRLLLGFPWFLKRKIFERHRSLWRSEASRPGAELTAGNAIPGPSRQQISAAGNIPPGEQRDMAEGMVASLEGKLQTNPANIEGWVMLMRSRIALGQPDRAAKALKDAVAANPGAAARLRQEAEILGVPGT